jgi:hypothetical protein
MIELYRVDPLERDEHTLEALAAVGLQLAGMARLLALAEKPRWR